jgi:hypothetical protein
MRRPSSGASPFRVLSYKEVTPPEPFSITAKLSDSWPTTVDLTRGNRRCNPSEFLFARLYLAFRILRGDNSGQWLGSVPVSDCCYVRWPSFSFWEVIGLFCKWEPGPVWRCRTASKPA